MISSPRSLAASALRHARRRARRDAIITRASTLHLEEAFHGTTRTLELRRPQLQEDGSSSLPPTPCASRFPRASAKDSSSASPVRASRPPAGARRAICISRSHILPHGLFQLDGRDVTLTFAVAPWEAALGATRHRADARRRGRDADSSRCTVGAEAAAAWTRPSRLAPGRSVRAAQGRAAAGELAEAKALYEQMRAKLNFNPRADLAR